MHGSSNTLALVLEDAKQYSADLITTKLDWKQAYNSVDHKRLYVVMQKLGFPRDAVDVVKSIYLGATTTIKTPHGHTAPIHCRRGVLQGDILSPFLQVMMEPLLCWLENAKSPRGYMLNCVAANTQQLTVPQHHRHAAADGYADDTMLMSGTVADLQVQLDKVSIFGAWSGIYLNVEICETSAIMYHTAKHHNSASNDPQLVQQTLQQLRLDGKQPRIVQPTEPFKYLGITLTLDLNWSHQVTATRAKISDRVAALNQAPVTEGMARELDAAAIIGGIRHTFAVAPYTLGDLEKFDRMRAAVLQHQYALPKSFHAQTHFASYHQFGVGQPSLVPHYVQALGEHFCNMLNDSGRLGTLAHRMLHTIMPAVCATAAAQRGHGRVAYTPLDPETNDTSMLDMLCSPAAPEPLTMVLQHSQQHHPPLPLQPPPPPNHEHAEPTTTALHYRYMLSKMHAWLADYHFKVNINADAPAHYTFSPNLWETLTEANRMFSKGLALDHILLRIACPLWSVGVYKLQDIMHTDGASILTYAQFTQRHPNAGASQETALRAATHLLCRLPGQGRGTAHTNILPVCLRSPHTHSQMSPKPHLGMSI
jgi:hypothetical protein